MDYAKNYPSNLSPSKWFVEETIRKAGLQTKKPKEKKSGGSEYLLYPVQSIKKLGLIQQSADFIGKKYIAGKGEPINIFSTSYYRPFKLYQIRRILAEKAIYAIEVLKELWQKHPIPNVFRIDNGLQYRGTASGKRSLGIFLKFLLNLKVIPLFGSPSKPWTNPHIEGHNRVFNEKVWGRNFFNNLNQIDTECERFNNESLELFYFKYSLLVFNGNFNYLERQQEIRLDKLLSTKNKKIYFIRFVESFEQQRKSYITILNESIYLPEKYGHQFVFVEWNIEKELLSIYSEYKKIAKLIYQTRFRLNI